MCSKSQAAILLLTHHLHLGSLDLSEGITCLNAQHMNSAGPQIENIKPQLLHLCINISCQGRKSTHWIWTRRLHDNLKRWSRDLDHQDWMGTEPFHKKACLFLLGSKPANLWAGWMEQQSARYLHTPHLPPFHPDRESLWCKGMYTSSQKLEDRNKQTISNSSTNYQSDSVELATAQIIWNLGENMRSENCWSYRCKGLLNIYKTFQTLKGKSLVKIQTRARKYRNEPWLHTSSAKLKLKNTWAFKELEKLCACIFAFHDTSKYLSTTNIPFSPSSRTKETENWFHKE